MLYGALGLVVLVPLLAWTQRQPIAKELIDRELAKRGVPASYVIKAVGTKRQRLERIVIGDPRNPDLTAEWAEIDTSLGWSGVTVRAVRARGVRVKGALIGGALKLGAVDKLLPPPSADPFTLPDIDLALYDARMRLDTEYGHVGARLDGAGNLTQRFAGKLALVAPQVERGDCRGDQLSAFVGVAVQDRKISIKGPVRAANIACSGSRAQKVALMLDATVPELLNAWSGSASITADQAIAPGAIFRAAALTTDFTGDRDLTTGKFQLAAGGLAASGVNAGQTGLDGSFRISLPQGKGPIIESNGTLNSKDARPSKASLAQMLRFGTAGAGTPAEPIVAALARAVSGLDRGSSATARYVLNHDGTNGRLQLSGISAQSVSGAKLSFAGADSVRYIWQPGGLLVKGRASLSGGGFPTSDVVLAGEGGRWNGTAIIAPLVAGDTRIALSPVTFSTDRRGARISTTATIDGRFGTTRFAGLKLPVSLAPGASMLAGCMPLSFNRLDVAGLSLAPSRLQTCFVGQEARIAAPQLAGMLGQSPIRLSARTARYGLSNGQFALDGLGVRLGPAQQLSVLDLGALTGRVNGGAASGQFAGGSGRIGAVPLNMDGASGTWQIQNSILSLKARVGVSDQQAAPRFQPLVSNDFALKLADGRITATGMLSEQQTGANVSRVDIAHTLSSGTGSAVLSVPGITFNPQLQPEQLTRITLGVIANVEGGIAGRGEIRWSPAGVKSDGRFTTEGLNLAAAFGPVRQMKGEIVFTDLLGMETAPGQSVQIAEINAGVQVTEGVVRYRLLPGLKAEIEGGRWPFSGGELILEPTVLDLSESAERRLTFRVVALDAAKFINALQFENIAATGVFDGVIPMIFDKNGGRIEAGNLIVREEGGTLSYVGEVSQENLGTYGSIAFDALKSIKYKKLSIDLGGPLDAEMVTQIRFNGVNQSPIIPGRAKLPIPIKIVGLTGIPFIFNITIKAPFRGLVTMARSFQDPSGLIQDQLERERRREEELKQQQPNPTAPPTQPEQ